MIRKMPTIRAIPANTSRKVCRKPRIRSRLSLLFLTLASPVRATTPAGSTFWAALASSAWETPFAAVSDTLL